MTGMTLRISRWAAGLCGLAFGLTLAAVASLALAVLLG